VILGLGTDIVAVDRIADLVDRYGDRFTARVFSEAERALAEGRGPAGAAALAARWAAREAFLKALGGDVRAVPYGSIEVVRAAAGPVSLRLSGAAADALDALGGRRVHLALSHERTHAVAVVIIED